MQVPKLENANGFKLDPISLVVFIYSAGWVARGWDRWMGVFLKIGEAQHQVIDRSLPVADIAAGRFVPLVDKLLPLFTR